jgi:hypothetical protein
MLKKNKTKKNVAAVKADLLRKEAKPARTRVADDEAQAATIDRRKGADRRKQDIPVTVERRAKVARRRQIDPTTCERDYSAEELEFMNALELYKRSSGRMFPTCSEVLEVLRGLGYQKQATPDLAALATPADVPMPVFETPVAPVDPVAI